MRIAFAIIFLVTSLLASCGKSDNNTNTAVPANTNSSPGLPDYKPIAPTTAVNPGFKACNPYYPLVPGSMVKYKIEYSSGLLAGVTIVVDSADEGGRKTFVETTQIVDSGGGLEKLEKMVRKYVCDGERVQINYEKGNNRAGNLANDIELKFLGTAVALLDPASLTRHGTKWSYSFKQVFTVPGQRPIEPEEPITINFEALGDEVVKTDAGEFKTVKIGRRVGDKLGTDFFARGIGLVKRIGPDGTAWKLVEYSGVKPLE